MPKEKLEHKKLDALKPPEKVTELFDTIASGLGVRLSVAGSKTFFYRYRFHGKNKRYTIGEFPVISLAEARKRAGKLKAEVTVGIDPQAEKDLLKTTPEKEITFFELCKRFKKRHLPTLKEKTKNEYERIIDKEITPILGSLPAKDVRRKELIDLIDSIAFDRNKKTLSNRVRAVLSSIFSFGIDKAIIETNPVLHIRRKKNETKRDRVYSPEEIKKLWNAFDKLHEPVKSLFKMLLMCGQRSGETRRMRWEDLDFENKYWVIPEKETKAKRKQIVPLTDVTLYILLQLKPITGGSDYVFNSPKLDNKPIEWLQKASDRIKKESEISDFRIHDLRRSMASYLAQLGTDRTVLGKILNHKGLSGDDQVTAIYDRYDYLDEKRRALTLWGLKLLEIVSPENQSATIYKLKV
jgi:integrase